MDRSVFEGIQAAIVADRPEYFRTFLDDFFNVDKLSGTRISDSAWKAAFNMALDAGPFATYACVETWMTDFRPDLPKIDVPVLVLHGDEDRILPYPSTAVRLPGLIKDLTLITVEGGSHNIPWTHPEIVNPALLDFLKANDKPSQGPPWPERPGPAALHQLPSDRGTMASSVRPATPTDQPFPDSDRLGPEQCGGVPVRTARPGTAGMAGRPGTAQGVPTWLGVPRRRAGNLVLRLVRRARQSDQPGRV